MPKSRFFNKIFKLFFIEKTSNNRTFNQIETSIDLF